ncbi:MAG TPA: type II toxin-antitoxin system HicA family toxin [Vicinamibacteria bacterium]|nr:type II toxin-antitoxin system HicA family toxin [Vicinamibacteria bacterium]
MERAGFFRKSQRGSHLKVRHPDARTFIVPGSLPGHPGRYIRPRRHRPARRRPRRG